MSRDLELIEDFLHGRLSPDDELTFENKKSSDVAFTRLLEKEQKLLDTLSDVKSRNFIRSVKEIVETTPLQKNTRKGLQRGVGIAIAASLLLVSGILFLLPAPAQSPEVLFQKYFTSYPMLLAQRDAVGSFQDFVSMYQNEDWDEVIRMAGDPGIQDAYPKLIDLYQSIAHLQRGEGHKALQILQQEKDLDPDLSIAFLWYQSMAYLQVGDQNQARESLSQLIDRQPGGSWQRDARQILQAIK